MSKPNTRSSTLETLRDENKVLKWKLSSYEEILIQDYNVNPNSLIREVNYNKTNYCLNNSKTDFNY